MKQMNERMDRNREAELALKEHILIKRDEFLYRILRMLNQQEIEEEKFQQLLAVLQQFESEQIAAINAYQHEKNLNDHFFDGM